MLSRRRGRPGLLGTVAETPVPTGGTQVAAAPQTPVEAQPAAVSELDLVASLSRLAHLRDSGALSEAEFQLAKGRILA